MDTYTRTITTEQVASWSDDRDQAMTEYLAAQIPPIAVTAITVYSNPPRVEIMADTDPIAALQNWTPGISAQRQKLRDAKQRIADYRTICETWIAGTGPAPTELQKVRFDYDISTVVIALAKRMDVG